MYYPSPWSCDVCRNPADVWYKQNGSALCSTCDIILQNSSHLESAHVRTALPSCAVVQTTATVDKGRSPWNYANSGEVRSINLVYLLSRRRGGWAHLRICTCLTELTVGQQLCHEAGSLHRFLDVQRLGYFHSVSCNFWSWSFPVLAAITLLPARLRVG